MLDPLVGGLPYVIGFCGFKGSGKDTSADYLCSRYDYQKTLLAYPLKKACQQIFGFTDEAVFGASSLREKVEPHYPLFSGRDPVDGTMLTKVANSSEEYWRRDSDGEWFPERITPRLALTSLGTEWGRRLYSDIWADACMNFIRASGSPLWTISDVRFMNEITSVQRAGGKVIRLLRGQRQSNHPSEMEMESIPFSEFDYVVDNQGPKEELYELLDDVMAAILPQQPSL